MSGLVSYGGDTQVVATRSEIERITGELSLIQRRLVDELQPMAQLSGLVHHAQLDLQLPETLVRLGIQRHGCFIASESYFTADAQVAHRLESLAQTLHDNPWLSKMIPKEAWIALAATTVVAGFTNTDITSQVIRATGSQIPVTKIDLLTQVLPSEPVLAKEVAASSFTTPKSIGDLTNRLRSDSGNIRIESYQSSAGRVLVVYLPGTANWSPVGGKSAFDMRSNIELIGDTEKSNSSRAANAAITAFGEKTGDRLILVGYSQGGMVAAEIAETNKNVVGLVTIGAPVAEAKVPTHLPTLSIEHSNDLVPALAGETNPLTENWATASRHLEIEPGQTVIDAHNIDSYAETARMVDSSDDAGLNRVRKLILQNLSSAPLIAAKEYAPLKAGALP